MFSHEASTTIAVSPRDGFEFLADPRNQVKITPGFVALSETPPRDGFVTRYQYEFAGVTLSGVLHDELRRPPTRLIRSLSGALEGSVRYRLGEAPDGTHVTCAMTVRLPGAVRESIPETVAETAVEQDVTGTVATLRSFLEG